jgi:hypothetical protein
MVHEIAHRVKLDGGLRARYGGSWVPEKMRMALCRASIRLPFPTSPGKPRAPRHDRHAGHGVARGELATGRCAMCNQIRDELIFWFFVDWVAGDASDRAPALFSPHPRHPVKPVERFLVSGWTASVAWNVGLGGWCGRSEGP